MRKSNEKLAENQPSQPSFPATDFLSSFSLRRGLQPPPPSSMVFPPSSLPQEAIKTSHVVVAPLLSLLCKTFILCHRNPSSSNHLVQKL
jgi:hypothetical protein